jgi:hypothetical protein
MSVEFRIDAIREQEPLGLTMFHEWTSTDGSPWLGFYRRDTDYVLRFADLADFQVSTDGRSIRCWPAPNVSDETIRHLHLNQVVPLALSRQGRLVFHASAVEIDERAIAFAGTSGRGKSTLAASFATNGFRFLTDDGLLVISMDGQRCIAPSQPSIRLWNDSQEALLVAGAPMAPAVQFTTKSRFLAGEQIVFCNEPCAFRRMYFLGEGRSPAPVFERMSQSASLIELVKHSFMLDIDERAMLAAHFDELADLVKLPIFFKFDYPRSYEMLPEVRYAVEGHSRLDEEA